MGSSVRRHGHPTKDDIQLFTGDSIAFLTLWRQIDQIGLENARVDTAGNDLRQELQGIQRLGEECVAPDP